MTPSKQIDLVAMCGVFAKIAALVKMKFSLNVAVQVLGTIIQGGNIISGVLPADLRDTVAIVIGIIQGVAALLAHNTNPNGTAATTAYAPPCK